MRVVCDTSPLTNLAVIGRLSILKTLYGRVLIPEVVARELAAVEPHRPGYIRFVQSPWIVVQQVSNQNRVDSLMAVLNRGEAEAIVLASESAADLLIIDERRGDQVARAQGIETRGLIGVLLRAKEEGLFPELRPILDELIQDAGFWISDAVYELALERAGE